MKSRLNSIAAAAFLTAAAASAQAPQAIENRAFTFNGVAWVDDRQVVVETAMVWRNHPKPYTNVQVEEIWEGEELDG